MTHLATVLLISLALGQSVRSQTFLFPDVEEAEQLYPDFEDSSKYPTSCPEGFMGKNCAYKKFDFKFAVEDGNFGTHWPFFVPFCSVYGKASVLTFDGLVYEHSGTCSYVVMESHLPHFKIVVLRDPECKHSDGCLKSVVIEDGDHVITMRGDDVSVEFWNGTTVNGGRDMDLWEGPLFVSKMNGFRYLSLLGDEVAILFDGRNEIMINLNNFAGQISGLCGDADGNRRNDREIDASRYQDLECTETYAVPVVDINCQLTEDVLAACMFLANDGLAACNSVVDPRPFVQQCIKEMCLCDYMNNEDCLCDIGQQYARVCAFSDVLISDWRSPSCGIPCDGSMQWTECGRGNVPSCDSVGLLDMFYTPCLARCECTDGTLWDKHSRSCKAVEQCSCTYMGKSFANGESRSERCNECTCKEGLWSCTDYVCSATAAAFGHYHFVTFDGEFFTEAADCPYILSEDEAGTFRIYVTNVREGDLFNLKKKVDILVKVKSHMMHYRLDTDGRLLMGKHSDDAHGLMKPQEIPHAKSGVEVNRYQEAGFTVHLVQSDMWVVFDGVGAVFVRAPGSMAGQLRGVAGNFNEKQGDDMVMPSGEPAGFGEFVQSWKKEGSTCSDVIYWPSICYHDDIERVCGYIIDDAHKTCGAYVNLEHVRRMCVEDACNTPQEMVPLVTCLYATAVVSTCSEYGVPDKRLTAQLIESCPVVCPANKVFNECGNTCTASCQSIELFCTRDCYPGCFCPEGTYENFDETCVAAEDCGCFYDGKWYANGDEASFMNNSKKCTCDGGKMECYIIDIECPGELEYFDCSVDENGFPTGVGGGSCEFPYRFTVIDECWPGCSCPTGKYATPDNKCVPQSECGCVGAGGKYFQPGESYQGDCNVCTCNSGTFTCTADQCTKTCSSSGGSHYQTFDGLMYDFHGECEYVLATDFCPNNIGGGLFSVVTKNVKCGTTGITCSKSVIVSIKSQQIVLTQGKAPEIREIPFSRHRRAVTGFTHNREAEIFVVKQKGLFTEISTCIGITILWDNGTRIYVRLTPEYQGKVCGLCGNYDGKDGNDFITRTGIIGDAIEFGNSWKMPTSTMACQDVTISSQVNDSCALRPARRPWSQEKCSVILDAKLFGECHLKINPQKYFDACVLDTCGCDSGGDCECMCTAIAHYAHHCAQKGVVVEWRNMKRCPLMCEIYNKNNDECRWHYRACDTCITDTCCPCQTAEDSNWCVEGCFPKCPEGFILDEMTQKCVSKENSDEECTWYSKENRCRVCEKCDVCKTKEGAVLRVQPGETKHFPLSTDTCEKETCVNLTVGDLCFNGTRSLYDCQEEFKPIPEYDPYFYELVCFNISHPCPNCRDCEKKCIIREDTCEEGRKIGHIWSKQFSYDPVPTIGPKTYCKTYKCIAHPDSTEPVCNLQVEEVVDCGDTGVNTKCEWYEELREFETGDPCCPVKYGCVCVTCQFSSTKKMDSSIKVGQSRDWCKDNQESNCCYTDTCYNKTSIEECPQIIPSQQACPTGPTPTCAPGHVWTNKTREADCCAWGECECDSCVDYDIQNNKRLVPIGHTWNKRCLKFRCTRDVLSEDGCYKPRNYENVTCPERPECPERMRSFITGKDEFDCCDTYGCECVNQCFVTIDNKLNAFEPGTEWKMDGCWHLCIDPKPDMEGSRTNQSDCPNYEQICHKPEECPTCHEIVGEEEDECGCPKYICKEIERCPMPDCPHPFEHKLVPSDPCKAPCYECVCTVCWDQFNNNTYLIGDEWTRYYREGERKCEDCSCTDEVDSDGCKKETCTRRPCPELEKCPSPYDEMITKINDCGCTVLVECRCPYCKFQAEVLDNKRVGSSWTVGDVERGCFDTYTCSAEKEATQEKECYNVTVQRESCPEPIECPPNYKRVKDEEKSCCYPDGECCDIFKCECIVCMFDEKAYTVGSNWTKDCIDYNCSETETRDAKGCYVEKGADVPCNDPPPECHDCYVSYRKHARSVPDLCCDVYDCKPELFCIVNGEKIPNGTEWYAYDESKEGCVKRMCYVSKENFTKGICPTPIKVNPCVPDLTQCEKCENRTIVKDVCGCDKVECPPFNDPVQCVDPAPNQKIISMDTADMCFEKRNCCVCDNGCLYKGVRRRLFEIWWDEEECYRMRCLPPTKALEKLSKYDIDVDDVVAVNSSLNYKLLFEETRQPFFIYDECQQDPEMCPAALNIGCPEPEPCGKCQNTTVEKDKCDCDVHVCVDYVCPPSPYDVTSCEAPKSKLIEITLKDLHWTYPCCPTGNKCVCPDGCYGGDGELYPVGTEWEETGDHECGTKRRYKCRVAVDGDPHECPQVEKIPCPEPEPCPSCHVTLWDKDDYCCDQVECVPMKCNVTTQKDCEEKYFPFTVMKTDAVKTKNECCPNYCDCPDVCVDEFDQSEHDKYEQWVHPKSACWNRICRVDKDKKINQGCPYIENRTICVEPEECSDCFHKVDTIDECGCTQRKCVKNECPSPPCTDECKEIRDSGAVDECNCPVLECRKKQCPVTNLTCDDPEMSVYSYMVESVNRCCPQYGCRCDFSKCEELTCPEGQVKLRNLTEEKCCCPSYYCGNQTTYADCMLGDMKKKIGDTWVNKDNVCEMMQCVYENARSKKTKIETYPRYSCSGSNARQTRSVTCANGGVPRLAVTKNGCCREAVCPCTCQLYGDPHYKTFDGLAYDFQGKCTYTLMKEYKFNDTEILVDNELCRWWSARNKDLSCLKTLTVLHKKNNYTFSFGQQFLLNGEKIAVPVAWQPEGSDVRIETYGYRTLQLQILSLGIEIIYKTRQAYQSLILNVPYETYEGRMGGMCGVCNNNPDDDITDSNGRAYSTKLPKEVDQFGAAWMKNVKDHDHAQCFPVEPQCPPEAEYPECPTELPSDECINCENRCHLTHSKCKACEVDPCEQLTSNDVFESCRSKIDAEQYVPQCRYDVALMTNATEVKCNPCNSPSVIQYAALCENAGQCVKWREALGCPVDDCPATQEFRECDTNSLKYRSCDNLTVWDDGLIVEGCFCPEGQVRKSAASQECVPTKCCFGCAAAPACQDGSEATASGEDECGCPIYYCQEESTSTCTPTNTTLPTLIANGEGALSLCFSSGTVVTELCDGMCRTETSMNERAELQTSCTSCKATKTTTLDVTLSCADGATKTVAVEKHLSCSCDATPCE